jgi:hypothetical protein
MGDLDFVWKLPFPQDANVDDLCLPTKKLGFMEPEHHKDWVMIMYSMIKYPLKARPNMSVLIAKTARLLISFGQRSELSNLLIDEELSKKNINSDELMSTQEQSNVIGRVKLRKEEAWFINSPENRKKTDHKSTPNGKESSAHSIAYGNCNNHIIVTFYL